MAESIEPPYILRNGEQMPAADPAISLLDPAIQYGHGLFETIRSYDGVPFALDRHLRRMEHGAKLLKLTAPTLEEAKAAIRRLTEANQLDTAASTRIRITLLAGKEQNHTCYQVEPCPEYPAEAIAITGPFVRNDRSALAAAKTINFGENIVAMEQARDAGASEAIWSDTRNNLCEGTWSNVFVKTANNQWVTPPLSTGCLPGVTREIVLEIAKENQIHIQERSLPMETFVSECKAAFFTSSIREIQPIAQLDGRDLESSADLDVRSLKKSFLKLRLATSILQGLQDRKISPVRS